LRGEFFANPRADDGLARALAWGAAGEAGAVVRALPGYAPTPLLSLPALAAELGVERLWVKDESKRFGLKAFKALGALYALHAFLNRDPAPGRGPAVFVAASAGNHGRGLAWAARRLGHRAVVYLSEGTAAARVEAIRGEGAEIVLVPGDYDDAVRQAAADAARRGWAVISDTAYEGYEEIPRWISQGYAVLFDEALEQLGLGGEGGGRGAEAIAPTLVMLQAGVGGLACGGAMLLRARLRDPRPALVCVEPTSAACLLASARHPRGEATSVACSATSMAGLCCGTPSTIAWPLLRAACDAFMAVDDDYAREAMRALARGRGGDPAVVAGASGAAGLAGLIALCREPSLAGARALLPPRGARVLLINTEGDTDPEQYRAAVGGRDDEGGAP
jgi:diaminopropionate ammonia-lyase